jgi:endonuclease YncB( thermonuclease family)
VDRISTTLAASPVVPTSQPVARAAVLVAQVPSGGEEIGLVTRIIDDDTIEVQLGEVGYRVRYIGIDTPERVDTCTLRRPTQTLPLSRPRRSA